MIKTATLCATIILGTVYASAAQQSFDDWSVFSGNGACWASTMPHHSESTFENRSTPYLSIQNHPSEGVRGSIAVTNGGVDASQMKAVIDVDGKQFATLTYAEAAFVGTGKPETNLTAAMLRGKEFKVTWTDKDGKSAEDRYSLTGFSAAKNEIDQNCK